MAGGPAQPPQLTVYFDGACPVCSREIAHYRQQPGAQACRWVDAAHCAPEALGDGLVRAQALGRFHVRLADGRLLVGAAGFAALWQTLPGWRWLGRLVQWAPVRPVAALAYAAFLRLRPLWRRLPPAPRPPA
jgi:predicted DCC family thiol-disulfide oxidoreductase YuxK